MRILIVEDECDLADALTDGLRRDGFIVDAVHDGTSALTWLIDNEVDVIVLDRDLPGVHGDQVARTLIAQGHDARILMLTAAVTLQDLVVGFDLGADDYLTKPFRYLELLARLNALGRRQTDRVAPPETVIERAGICIDLRRMRVERSGIPLDLTPKEYGVLRVLIEANGAWRSSTRLLDTVWDDPFARSTDVVKVVIHGLRQKLGAPNIVENRPGFGYRIP